MPYVCLQAKRMLEDLEALSLAYQDALSEVARVLSPITSTATPSDTSQKSSVATAASPQNKSNVNTLNSDLEADCGTATGRLQEAFRALLYIVLLSAQDRSLLRGG